MAYATSADELDVQASRAPLLAHLIEFRNRLIWAMLSFAICFLISFFFAKQIFAILTIPLAHALAGKQNNFLIYTALYETFFTYVKVAMFAGLCLAFPVIAAQLWLFVAPGLYKKERRALLPFLIAAPVLFVAGAALVFFVMLPFAIHFFLGYQTPPSHGALGIQLQAKVSEYLDFVIALILAFGLTFQMPVLLSLLGRVGIITSAQLSSVRRYSYVGIVALAAIVTPPDALSMISLAVPLVGLYEISIGSVKLFERQRDRER